MDKVSRMYKAKTAVGCDGFLPKVHLDLTKRNERRNCRDLGESGTEWKKAATSLSDDVFS